MGSIIVLESDRLLASHCAQISLVTPDGRFARVAGTGRHDYSGDGGPALDATLNNPVGMVVNASGDILVADSTNDVIRRLTVHAPATVTTRPAKPGEKVRIWGTGFGSTNPEVKPGPTPGEVVPITGEIEVYLGNAELDPENILFAGHLTAGAGLYVLDIRIPEDIADGNHKIVLRINDVSTPDKGFLSILR